MTPHEVLGVRPNASRDEIELAFRSRRSQYHPDKYAGMDAETLQWATSRMQEINVAYSALSNPEHEGESIESDARSTAPTPSASEERVEPAPEVTVSLGQLLRQRLAPYAGFSRIFFAPRIPPKVSVQARRLDSAV
jgi:curved DNA-binding protein CbpA